MTWFFTVRPLLATKEVNLTSFGQPDVSFFPTCATALARSVAFDFALVVHHLDVINLHFEKKLDSRLSRWPRVFGGRCLIGLTKSPDSNTPG